MKIYIVRGELIKGRKKYTRALAAFGTQDETFKAVRKYKSPGHIENVTYQTEDVPTDKAGLLEWVNKFCEGTPEEILG